MKVACLPSAEATGSRKRKVVPDSPQSSVGVSEDRRVCRHDLVAAMSCEALPGMRTSSGEPPANAVAIISRCAMDFDGGAVNLPLNGRLGRSKWNIVMTKDENACHNYFIINKI